LVEQSADKDESQSDASKLSSLPRIAIIDLMVLTTAMALVFALREKMNAIGWSFPTDVIWFNTLEHISFCAIYGFPLAAVYRFVVQKKYTGRFLLEPGHWLLFSTLLLVFASVIPALALGDLGSFSGGNNIAWFVVPYMLSSLVASWVLFRGSIVVGKWWKSIFVLMATKELIEAFQQFNIYRMFSDDNWLIDDLLFDWLSPCMEWITLVLQIVICVCLAALVLKELRKGPARDLWHWAGLLMPFLIFVVTPILRWVHLSLLVEPNTVGM
jgi:hypothetical protein